MILLCLWLCVLHRDLFCCFCFLFLSFHLDGFHPHRKLGYTDTLLLSQVRSFVVSFHSSSNIAVSTVPFDSGRYQSAVGTWVKAAGKATSSPDGRVVVYSLERSSTGITLAIENKTPGIRLVATVDCSASQNVVSHRGNLKVVLPIMPDTVAVAHHMGPRVSETWAWSFKLDMKREKI
jgi:hypothetical protein